jgi:hypothetical protein
VRCNVFQFCAAGCRRRKKEDRQRPGRPTGEDADPKPADPAAKPTEGAPATGDLPAECNDYKAMIEKLASCEKMPQQSRDALKQGYDAMSQGWANVGAMPAEAKKAMADGCKQGTDALKQAAGAMCGW